MEHTTTLAVLAIWFFSEADALLGEIGLAGNSILGWLACTLFGGAGMFLAFAAALSGARYV